MMFRGKVTKVTSAGVYVQTADFGTVGPCQAVNAPYTAGDMVLCVNVGDDTSPDLVVIGTVSATGSAASIPDGSITSAKIADGTIVNADISASAAIARSKISGLPTSSTDNTLPRFDSTGGALQTSGIVVDDNNRLRVASGSSGGLEIGSSGVLTLSYTGDPSGVTAPVGSTWRQTDANSTYGNLSGLLWNKVDTGTTLGTDWLVDFEGRIPHIRARGLAQVTSAGWNKLTFGSATEASRMVTHSSGTFTMSAPGLYQVNLQITQTAGTAGTRIVTSNGDYGYGYYWMFDDATNTPQRTVSGSRIYPVSTTLEMWCYTQTSITVDCMVQIAYIGHA